ncbi:phytoene desaturase family protein [Micropruina sonneratiae]|uniref:phytoene desaturase family protein n=1 Tax=Micropruina sonneratiae TaxID=2986940 RepID=UPI002227C529|nr:NAD(P)-binding protein [Micropruina sp. KQZ13P-5]MCW3159171.1 NAD(P)-binding protein [Micropruina sp. KQZ13P-5]
MGAAVTGRTPRVAIVGGGHNALTAAAYLARAGAEVTLLERLDVLGGAAISAQAFPGVEARLSRYAYLVSLLPRSVAADLGLGVELVRRRYSSYTPVPGSDRGLLIDNGDRAATEASFASIGAAADAERFAAFYRRVAAFAGPLFDTMTGPLPTASAAREVIGADWAGFVERPIGELIEASVADDLVRGVIATDALIGTFSDLSGDTEGNICLLYHVIGGGTGDWDVPVGGMGVVSGGIERAARVAGAQILTLAEVTAIDPDGQVTYCRGGDEHRLAADLVLCGAAPGVLAGLLGEPVAASGAQVGEGRARAAEGAQVKVNLLLRRLPALRQPGVPAEAAFGGTFHIQEGFGQLRAAHAAALAGRLPDPLPAEIYCHSLSDPSILGPELRERGYQTLTLFGLHVPDRLLGRFGNDELRDELRRAALASLDSVLAEPIEPLLATDAEGLPCIEVKTTADLEKALSMPGGNIFHGPLAWPWAGPDEALDTPARRWGVATGHDRVLLCGAGARRGGGVSGIAGQNAAMAAIEMLGL